MATQYPNGIDNSTTLPLVVDNVTEVTAETVNRLRDAVLAIEQALGINPQGTFTTTGGVRGRLDDVDASILSLETDVTDVLNEVDNIIANLDGTGLKLGQPSGGFSSGITTLLSTTPITTAIDTVNNIMSYLAPAQAQSMEGLALNAVTSLPVYTGKISTVTGAPSTYYGTFSAGSTCSRITTTQSFTLTSHNTGDSTTGFSDADKGILTFRINGADVTTFNLGTAFDEGYRTSTQGVSYSGNTGSNTPPLKTLSSTSQIYSIGLFNGFPLWQKGVARIISTALTSGYNSFQLLHTVGSTVRSSATFELFYDSYSSTPSIGSITLAISGTPTYGYLSGIRFIRTGSLAVTTSISNAFKNTYLQTPLSVAFTAGIPTSSVSVSDASVQVSPSNNPAAPNVNDSFNLAGKVFAISTANQQTINQIVTLTYTNVYGATFQAQAAGSSGAILVNTYSSPASTATTEAFVDENYRLLPNIAGATNSSSPYPNDYITLPSVITGQWTSTTALTNGNAQVYNARLIYPTINFTSGYAPTQPGCDYSGFNNTNPNSGQVYYRAMYSAGNPRSTGTLTIGGVSLTDLTQLSPHLKVEIKLPGPSGTGWLDLSKPFNNGTFTGITGDGCRTGASGSTFGWSVGTFTTANSGFMYILRITLFTTSRQITSLSESFIQTF